MFRVRRWSTMVVALVAIVLSSSVGHLAAQPARAFIANPIVADESGDPVEFLEADQALFAYFTVDIRGGDICVVNEDTVATPGRDCRSGVAWGTPNHFVGLGTLYQGLEAPFLVIGTWRLLAAPTPTSGNPNPTPALSAPFTVGPCTGSCDTTIGQAAIDEWKAAAGEATEGAYLACKALAIQKGLTALGGVASSVVTMRNVLYEAVDFAKVGVKASIETSAEVVIDFFGGLIAVPSLKSPTEEKAKELLKELLCSAALMHETIKEDPPDQGFDEVAQPVFGTIPDPGYEGSHELAVSLDRQRALGQAMLHAFERYLGAVSSDEPEFVSLQAGAIQDFGLQTAQEMRTSARLMRDYADILAADPDQIDPIVPDQATLDAITAINQRVVDDGFLPSELQQLDDLGLTAADIAQLRAGFGLDVGDVPIGENIDSLLHDTADAFEAAAVAYDAIAREAGSVSSLANPNHPPVADFTYLQPGSLRIDFDASSSSDPDPGDTLTYAWDFGDGTSGTGITTSHTYDEAATYGVKLTVSDGVAQNEQVRSVIVSATVPPVASFTASPTSGFIPLTVQFTNTSSDPEGETLTSHWDFGDGATSDETSPSHTFTTVDSFIVRLTVTDEQDTTDAAQQIIATTENVPPIAIADTITVPGRAVAFDPAGNDRDDDFETSEMVSHTEPAHGTLTCNTTGGCLYRPDAGFTGSDGFEYTIEDPHGARDTNTVTFDVVARSGGGAGITALADSLVTRAGTPRTIDVIANDTGLAGVADVTDASHGTVVCDGVSCTYTPDTNFTGYDGFRYTAESGGGQASADVLVLVAPADATLSPTVTGVAASDGSSTSIPAGAKARWRVGIDPAPDGLVQSAALLFGDVLDITVGSGQSLDGTTLRSARGWTLSQDSTGLHATPGSDALLGEAISTALPRPAAPISQGTGGDGHVPIVVGSRVYAFFHHSTPTSVSCIDRSTGALCPGYPVVLNADTDDIPGPAAVFGSQIWVHLYANVAPNTGPELYCWDTATDEACGLVVMERVYSTFYPSASAPVRIGAKAYFFGGPTEKFYCVDPVIQDVCAGYPLESELGPSSILDIVSHGTRVFGYANDTGSISCFDVSTGKACAGWTNGRTSVLAGNLLQHRTPAGVIDGVCVTTGGFGDPASCYLDADPATEIDGPAFPAASTHYNITSEADAPHQTYWAYGISGGLACWDWAADDVCSGPGFDETGRVIDSNGSFLPGAYGAIWDGSCVVALGDPGLVYTVGTDGVSPCVTLTTSADVRTVDLRDQRCDGTIGSATWRDARVLAADLAVDGEFRTFTLLVRDSVTGAVVASRELVGTNGVLDLSSVDVTIHPTLSIEAQATSASGAPAWADANPPRIELRWHADPATVCFDTTATIDCAATAPTSVRADALLDVRTAFDTVGVTRDCGTTTQPPVGTPDGYTATSGVALVVPAATGVLANDTDPDTSHDLLTASLIASPAHGTLTLASDGSFSYTSSASYTGPDSFTYRVSDGPNSAGPITVSLTIESANRPPALGAITDKTTPELTLFGFGPSGSDPDGDDLAWSLTVAPDGLSIDPTTGALSWTPTEAQGPATYPVTVHVSDGSLSVERSFTIAVTEVNSPPSLAAIADQTVHPGETVSLTASGSDTDVPADTLSYSITTGPSGATIGSSSGAFSWTAGTTLGDVPVTIQVSDGHTGGTASRSFTIHVIRDATSLTLGGATTGQYSDRATITATLRVGTTPVEGASVAITLGSASQTVTTSSTGVASATFTVPGPAGVLATGASFAGTSSKQPSSTTGSFTVTREDSSLTYSGDTIGLAGATIELKATFMDSAAAGFAETGAETGSTATIGDITKARVAFAIYAGDSCLTGSPITTVFASVTDSAPTGDGIGTARTTWSTSTEGAYCVVPSLVAATGTGANTFYVAPPAQPGSFAIYKDATGKVTGGGWIRLGDGRANFGFNASSVKGPVKGNVVFIQRTTYAGKKAMLIVKSNAIDALRSSGTTFPITATLSGKATIKFISSADGSTLFESGNATFEATVVDTNRAGADGDSFGIVVRDKNGVLVTQISLTPLGGGNIVAHLK